MVNILKSFNLPETLYADDVQNIVGNCIARFGEREWKLVVMTGEIHGHLGIYSTLGAKMGLFARECFEAQGLDGHISVLSFAGAQPPVSCLNDGLQISTGATLGHGLISVSPEENKRVEAIFTCGGSSLHLRLKPSFESQIKADIAQGVANYSHSPAYWQYVRELALRYWSDWDRREIFEEV